MLCSVLNIQQIIHEVTKCAGLLKVSDTIYLLIRAVKVIQLTGQVPLEMIRSKESISGTPFGVITGCLELRTDSVVSDIMEEALEVVRGT